MPTTKLNGIASTGTPPESDMTGMHSIIVKIKKYKFANFENYNIKFSGKNVKTLYFEV